MQRATVMPHTRRPSMHIDAAARAIFLKLLAAEDEAAVSMVCRDELHFVVQDNAYPSEERTSMARFRTLVSELCVCGKSSDRQLGVVIYVHSCFLFYRLGTCSHQLLERWLAGGRRSSTAHRVPTPVERVCKTWQLLRMRRERWRVGM